jgi:hypothetical protein
MKRRAWLSIYMVVAVFVAMSTLVARADECPNKWNDPIEKTAKGATRGLAQASFH